MSTKEEGQGFGVCKAAGKDGSAGSTFKQGD